ncbi:MAG: Thioredoxin reductase [bacterium ADurb.Bin212]|nr:MAG: Thioredoxin reductase [bacterium ADurb.Bin212]
MYDIAIVGGGVAGITAAIFAARRQLKTAILFQQPGGQLPNVLDIENWPGEEHINGADLANKLLKHLNKYPIEIKYAMAEKIEKQEDAFIVKSPNGEVRAKSLVLAYGKSPSKLNVKGEEDFIGRGISYCVNCDGQFFKGKAVAVVGGGNSALETALTMAEIASSVYLLHRKESFRGDEVLIDKVINNQKIEKIFNDEIVEIKGENVVNSILTKTGREISVDGVFVEVGHVADDSIVRGLVETNESKHIITDRYQATSCPGIFAAGDITDLDHKQLIIASGQGANAALSAVKYLQGLKK